MSTIRIGAATQIVGPTPPAFRQGGLFNQFIKSIDDDFYALHRDGCLRVNIESVGGSNVFEFLANLDFELTPSGWGTNDGYKFGRAMQAGLYVALTNFQTLFASLLGPRNSNLGSPMSMEAYAEIVYLAADMVHNRHGIPVDRVYWLLQNEPPANYISDRREFFRQYAAGAFGVDRATKERGLVGGIGAGFAMNRGWSGGGHDPDQGDTPVMQQWIMWCAKPDLHEPFYGGGRVPIRVCDWHRFGIGVDSIEAHEVRRWLSSAGYNPSIPFLLTEYHVDNGETYVHQRDAQGASFMVAAAYISRQQGFKHLLYATVIRGGINPTTGWDNAYGMTSQDANRLCKDTKWMVWEMMKLLGPNEITLDLSDNDCFAWDIMGIAAASADGKTRYVLLTRFPRVYHPFNTVDTVNKFYNLLRDKFHYEPYSNVNQTTNFNFYYHATGLSLTNVSNYIGGSFSIPSYLPAQIQADLAACKTLTLQAQTDKDATVSLSLVWGGDASKTKRYTEYAIQEGVSTNNPYDAYKNDFTLHSDDALALAASQAAQTLTATRSYTYGPPPTSITLQRYETKLLVASETF